jgi:hypothetical protein
MNQQQTYADVRRPRRRWAIVGIVGALAAAIGVSGCVPPPPPNPQVCVPIDFEDARVIFRPGPTLQVVGPLGAFRTVELRPVQYIQQPEYWEINVIGCGPQGGAAQPSASYLETLSIADTLGTKGVAVVSGDKRVLIDVSWDPTAPTTTTTRPPERPRATGFGGPWVVRDVVPGPTVVIPPRPQWPLLTFYADGGVEARSCHVHTGRWSGTGNSMTITDVVRNERLPVCSPEEEAAEPAVVDALGRVASWRTTTETVWFVQSWVTRPVLTLSDAEGRPVITAAFPLR